MFYEKNPLLVPGLKPQHQSNLCRYQGIALLKRICISTINHFALIGSQYSGGSSRGYKTTEDITSEDCTSNSVGVERLHFTSELPGSPKMINSSPSPWRWSSGSHVWRKTKRSWVRFQLFSQLFASPYCSNLFGVSAIRRVKLNRGNYNLKQCCPVKRIYILAMQPEV